METVYYCRVTSIEEEATLVRGAPYSFITSLLGIDVRNKVFRIVSSFTEISLSSEGVKKLPFLRGHITPYRRDNRFVMFNPIVGPADTFAKSTSFRIYADKTKLLESGEVLAQMNALKYPSGIVYPAISSASAPLSNLSLEDILPLDFLSSE